MGGEKRGSRGSWSGRCLISFSAVSQEEGLSAARRLVYGSPRTWLVRHEIKSFGVSTRCRLFHESSGKNTRRNDTTCKETDKEAKFEPGLGLRRFPKLPADTVSERYFPALMEIPIPHM